MNIWLANATPPLSAASAVTIGNFDGVHLGHRHILQRLSHEAAARGLQSVAVIFEPQPSEFFSQQSGREPSLRLSPLRDKLRLLAQTGCLNAVRVLRFNPEFANQTAENFVAHILRQQLNTKYLLIGDDFRFGKQRLGDFNFLAQQPDFVTEQTPSILVAGERASSTAVRQALQNGRLDLARQILGHDYVLSGHVKHGKKLGRKLGSPTANVHLPAHNYALRGVFVVEVSGSFGRKRGVASLGYNPTVSHSKRSQLEVHLFDFHGDLYGERLEVAFLHKLRDEQKFDNLHDLQQQIHLDMSQAKAWQN